MSSYQQQFLGTPTFELFRRGLLAQTIQKFRGINSWSTLAQLGPEWAQDVLNVIVAGSGGLSKLRLPVIQSAAIPGIIAGPNSFWDFQQANGTRQVLANFGSKMYYFNPTIAPWPSTFIEDNPLNSGSWSFAEASNILFGANGQRLQKWLGGPSGVTNGWQAWGLPAGFIAPVLTATNAGNLSPATGYFYGWAPKNSVTGHVGNISPVSVLIGAGQVNKSFVIGADNINQVGGIFGTPLDSQIDTIVWFRSLDGGGDMYRLAEVSLLTGNVTFNAATVNTVGAGVGGAFNGIVDNTPDSALDQTIRGPLINNPPLQGKFVATGQNRMVIFRLTNAPQDFIYSGYEQIFFGRPEESFPPNNRIRLSIGAEEIAGGGILQSGVVAFSNTGRMYMLRGQLEDITLAVPVNFTQYLEELPWTLGCASHLSIQATPYGLIWLAGDKTVQMFDGRNEPIDISPGIYPYLRRITPGQEVNASAAYFNWLERDFYVLTCAVDGSLTPNRLFIFAFNKAIGTNEIQTVEVFVSDVLAVLGGITWAGVITTSKLQRTLCVASGGLIQQLPVSSDTTGGITTDFTIVPPTNGNLNAYWRGGYFGNDAPQRSKLFRWLRLITDQDPKSFLATLRYVDDEQRTFVQPEIVGPVKLPGSRLGLNRRAKRMAVEINFPPQDVPANVLELTVTSVPTSDR